jgi:hypothetical protein
MAKTASKDATFAHLKQLTTWHCAGFNHTSSVGSAASAAHCSILLSARPIESNFNFLWRPVNGRMTHHLH